MEHPHRRFSMGLVLVCIMFIGGCSSVDSQKSPIKHASDLTLKDPYTLVGTKNLNSDYDPLDPDGHICVVIEIPTGTNAKWEVDKHTGGLKWEIKNGKPRMVRYLGYPGNYGMIPRTMLPKNLGGDGDPLDVIVLGSAVPRGSVQKARLIGVMRMLDGGEQDDKLIAVKVDSPLGDIHSIAELDRQFHGITRILDIWFSNYKGPGKIKTKGFGEVKQAKAILNEAIAAYAHQHQDS